MRNNELEKQLEKGGNVAHTVMINRGTIIELASDIENELTNIITWCFYPAQYSIKLLTDELLDENGIMLKSIILRKLDFCDKINILKEVILAKKPEIWNNYSHLIRDIISNLDKARDFRNLMAHASSDLSDKYLKSVNSNTYKQSKEFQIIEYKKGKLIKHRFNQNQIETKQWKLVKIKCQLIQLFAIINGDFKTFKQYEEIVKLTPI